MSIEPITMYQAVCDGCRKRHGELSEYLAWESEDTALTVATESDWQWRNKALLCWDCWIKESGQDEEE